MTGSLNSFNYDLSPFVHDTPENRESYRRQICCICSMGLCPLRGSAQGTPFGCRRAVSRRKYHHTLSRIMAAAGCSPAFVSAFLAVTSKFLLTIACRSEAPREHYVPVGMYIHFSKSVKGLITDSPYQPLHLFGIKRRFVNLFSDKFLKFSPKFILCPLLPFHFSYYSVTPILLRRRLSARFRETLHAAFVIFSAFAI